MIEAISVCNDASFTTPQSFAHLKGVNFVFGANGSGKTTISRVIADPALFPKAAITWEHGRAIETCVYNTDFVRQTFVPQMRGIFTLGKDSADTLGKIADLKKKVDESTRAIDALQAVLGLDDESGKRKEKAELRTAFEATCWNLKRRHDEYFKGAFTGVRADKAKFCDRTLSEADGNTADLVELDTLKQRAETVFQDNLVRIDRIVEPSFADLSTYESNPALAKKIVGKDDVDVAAIIKRLGNSDWVKAGMVYLETAEGQCPFCQQVVSDKLGESLNEYFDETYLNDIAALKSLREGYATLSTQLISRLDGVINSGTKQVDNARLQSDRDRLAARAEANVRLIERKLGEPSSKIVLEPTGDITRKLSNTLASANQAIDTHNKLVDNLATERQLLIAQIWKYVIEEEKAAVENYRGKINGIEKAISALEEKINKQRGDVDALQNDVRLLEQKITSVQPTVDAINETLQSFGFTGFRLRTAGERGHLYEIVRADGADASQTLSEGEKGFIAFLYFYNLIRGSHTQSGMSLDRVVVFDDPVSSLDSDVLFIVGALIKRVLREAAEGFGQIKQVFVLTHNIYFHKEVSFDPKRTAGCRAHETFWIVRKNNDASTLLQYDHNPIQTAYELLWEEVRKPDKSLITLQNTLRRILEYYFKILGNRDKDAIIELFEGRDKQLCASLFAWVNDGSHSVHDDLYVSHQDGTAERYLDVFKRVFAVTKHEAHYNMMMRTDA